MNYFGTIFQCTTWGESHGKAVGVVIDGCPAGLTLSASDIQQELKRRCPGQSKLSTQRKELDQAEILGGVFKGRTLGTPISILVWNKDSKTKDYQKIKNIYRPGHADFTWQAKYGLRDWRGGGRASGRETVGRVAAGAVAKLILNQIGVQIAGYVKQIGRIKAKSLNFKSQIQTLRKQTQQSIVRCPDINASKEMIKAIEQAKKENDSLGGIVAVMAYGVPAGWGEPVFAKLDAKIAQALMSIPAVKGVEIGSGFKSAKLRGSKNNDSIQKINNNQKVALKTKTNNAGGILGGISNGMPIVVRIAVKPTPSIAKEQETVDQNGRKCKIKIKGRHDPCVCPRIVPVAEAMVALVLVDSYLLNLKQSISFK